MDIRLFDLNIETILEAWDAGHAARELIANALDEQVLTDTAEVEIYKDELGRWVVRDFGRGLRYEHLTQNENPEKLNAVGRVIGRFGIGLKDALATLYRNNTAVEIESAHNVITLEQRAKRDFGEVVTLHAAVAEPRDRTFSGTAVRLASLPDSDMAQAKGYFLKFSGETVIEETRFGRILAKAHASSRIYVAGVLVAEEPNFAFSYDITSLTAAMKKALNRERTNVGRSAYSDRVKAMLLQTQSQAVAKLLADQLTAIERGTASDEVQWKEVAVHATRILSASGQYLFVTASQLLEHPSAMQHAQDDGLQIVMVPDSVHTEVANLQDLKGEPIRDLTFYGKEWNQSFKFDWLTVEAMSPSQRAMFARVNDLVGLVGGMPAHVRNVRVSRTMRQDIMTGADALGVWDPDSSSIVIRADQLNSLEAFAGVLLHEVAHARSGCDDVTRDFENELTKFLGSAAAIAISRQSGPARKSFWQRG